ncbi:Protein of unknown function [Georgenia satyanarayanai]|uniref:DUF4235 domain-containing protein n=1 Tax=Georgenia satyanarayanai TaxID=860221 RepID=A0A2Y9C718_9MICO|nr:DUF4235 domain-containing protein [Georgenia satyanarayanai]PYF99081.1 uncharacterized protein DUF4235 [Georgenia satyanarayanai]SSA44043.1 Protein of unknown function [Georgenia satyanarayanai]
MDIGWKIVSTGSAVLAGLLANKLLDIGWKAVTGHEPPGEGNDDPAVSLTEVVVFAAVSGAVIGLSRQLAQAGAAKWYGGPVEEKAPNPVTGP